LALGNEKFHHIPNAICFYLMLAEIMPQHLADLRWKCKHAKEIVDAHFPINGVSLPVIPLQFTTPSRPIIPFLFLLEYLMNSRA